MMTSRNEINKQQQQFLAKTIKYFIAQINENQNAVY